MITLVVTYCMIANPYLCRSLELAPQDGHVIVSIPECLHGGAVGSMAFTLEHVEWRVKGWRCTEKLNPMQVWLRGH